MIVCERAGIYDVAKLLDFGLVKSVRGEDDTTLTQEGMVAGTPAYFLLTGRLLFVKANAMQTLAAHLYEPVVPPSRFRPELDPTLEAVIMRCVAKKPEERYPDIAALDRALSSCPGAG